MQEQVVAFPLVGGVDESTAPRLCSRLLTMSNCRQMKTGSIEKRYGTNCVGPYNARFNSGPTPPHAELLAAYGTELVRIGYGHVDTCKTIGSTDCIYKGRASEALIYRQQLTSGDSYIVNTDVAYGNGYTVYVCASNAGILLSGTKSIVYFVLDSTGAVVIPRTVLDSDTSTAIGGPRVVVVGGVAIITWVRTISAAAAVVAVSLDLTTLFMNAVPTTLIASVVNYNICGLDTTFAVTYDSGSAIKIGTWTAAFSVSVAAVTVASVTGATAMGVEGDASGALFVAYGTVSGGTLSVHARGYDPSTLSALFANTALVSASSSDSVLALGIGLNAAATTAWVAWTVGTIVSVDVTTTTTSWTSITSAGTPLGTVGSTVQSQLVSKPFVANGILYALTTNVHSTHGTIFLVHLWDNTAPATTGGQRVVAVSAPRQAPRGGLAMLYGAGFVSSVANTASGRYAIAATVNGSIEDSFVASLLDVRLGSTSPVAAQIGGLLVTSGGVISAYDGAAVAELGMPYEPDVARATASITTGGSMSAGIYYYLIVYEWRFANGAVVRSIPDYPFAFATVNPDGTPVPIASQGLLAVTASSGFQRATLLVPTLSLTNKQMSGSGINAVSVVLYRTVAGGATFYRASAIQLDASSYNSVSSPNVTILDGLDDATLQTRPTIYTTGNVLPSEIPSSAAHVAAIQNRIWLSSTDDDTIWVSNEVVDGEAPAFSGSITIAPFEGGRVVGIAQLVDNKIIFKGESIYTITGTGPGIDGLNGSFSTPERVTTEVGCIDARSIVTTAYGVMFLSQNGLALLGLDLSVTLIGTQIENTVGSTLVCAATLVADQGLVRFALATSGTCRTVEYDTFHDGVWGSNTYVSPSGAGGENIAGAAYCRGSWFYINSAGLLFQEVKTSWNDVNNFTSPPNAYVQQTARLQYISLSGIQGYQRVWWVGADMTRLAPHDLTMKLYVDDARSTTQTKTWLDTVASTWPRYQAQIHVVHQECEALSVEVSDAPPTGEPPGTGRGFALFGVSAEIGTERGIRRAPAAQSG